MRDIRPENSSQQFELLKSGLASRLCCGGYFETTRGEREGAVQQGRVQGNRGQIVELATAIEHH